MVSDIHRRVLESPEGAGNQRWAVSDTWAVPATKFELTVA